MYSPSVCKVRSLSIISDDETAIKDLSNSLNIPIAFVKAPVNKIILVIDTPKGQIKFE